MKIIRSKEEGIPATTAASLLLPAEARFKCSHCQGNIVGVHPLIAWPGAVVCGSSRGGSAAMVDVFLHSPGQMKRIKPFFPLSHGILHVDNRRVVSGIGFVTCLQGIYSAATVIFWLEE